MPAIGDLLGMGQRDAHGLRVGTGPIPRDDLDGRVPAQPLRRSGSLAANENLDGLTSLQIDNDRSVVVTTSDGPVIDPNYPRLVTRPSNVCAPQLTQHRVRTGVQPQRSSQPGGGFASERMTKSLQGAGLGASATLMAAGQKGSRIPRRCGAHTQHLGT